MRVLVTYASRCGATQGIAERIAATMRNRGFEVTIVPADEAGDPVGYDAAVIGSAAYFFHWMKPATRFVWRNLNVLSNRPVWLFSSGPLGTKEKDDQGRELCEVLEPREIAEFRQIFKPRDHRVFFGAMNPAKLSFPYRLFFKLPANRNNTMFPLGDFRDWNTIDTWAGSIADALNDEQAE